MDSSRAKSLKTGTRIQVSGVTNGNGQLEHYNPLIQAEVAAPVQPGDDFIMAIIVGTHRLINVPFNQAELWHEQPRLSTLNRVDLYMRSRRTSPSPSS